MLATQSPESNDNLALSARNKGTERQSETTNFKRQCPLCGFAAIGHCLLSFAVYPSSLCPAVRYGTAFYYSPLTARRQKSNALAPLREVACQGRVLQVCRRPPFPARSFPPSPRIQELFASLTTTDDQSLPCSAGVYPPRKTPYIPRPRGINPRATEPDAKS